MASGNESYTLLKHLLIVFSSIELSSTSYLAIPTFKRFNTSPKLSLSSFYISISISTLSNGSITAGLSRLVYNNSLSLDSLIVVCASSKYRLNIIFYTDEATDILCIVSICNFINAKEHASICASSSLILAG